MNHANASHYEILVSGLLSERVLTAFPDMHAETLHGVTVLVGDLPDQAALHGVLSQIEALGLELLEVRRRGPAPRDEPRDSTSPSPVRQGA